MGVAIGFSRCSDDYTKESVTTPNPNKFNFKILDKKIKGDYLLVHIIYPDCTTFDGKKLILFKGIDFNDLSEMSEIDPHFLEDNNVAARFRCNTEGLHLANILLNNI